MRPPGTAYNRSFFYANNDTILVFTGVQIRLSSASFDKTPGLISTYIPTLSTPSSILPPTTPPAKLSIDSPGLFTSKLLIIIILGGTSNFLLGKGI